MAKQRSTTYVPWRLLASIFLLSFVLAIYFVIKPGPREYYNVVVNLIGILYSLGMGMLCIKGMRPFLRSPTAKGIQQTGWRFVPLLLSMMWWVFTLSQIVWFVSAWPTHQPPKFPGPQQFIILLIYPFLISAILLLPSRSLSALARLRLFLDSLLIMAAFTTLCYYYILAPVLVKGHGTMLDKIVASIFTQLDLVVIFCLLLVALRGGETALRPVLFMLTIVVLSIFIEHITHLYEILYTSYNGLSPTDAFLFLSVIMAVGAAQTLRRMLERGAISVPYRTETAEQADLLYPTARRAILPSVLVLLFGVLIFWIWLTGGDRHFRGQIFIVYAGGFVVLLLMVLRQFLAVYEVNRLQREVRRRNRSLNALNDQLAQLATTDALTGLPNHCALVKQLNTELTRARAQQSVYSLLFIDIDNFKSVNDRYGHLVGDEVLRQFGALVESMLRPIDYLGRWGGEEFVVFLAGAGARNAHAIAERIRLRVEQHQFAVDDEFLHLTCSLGIATYPAEAREQETLLMLADSAMYAAKRLGRNQTRAAREPGVLVLGMAAETPAEPQEREVLDMVEALVALQEVRDRPTGQHERRVASLALRLARSLNLSDREAYVVSLGGLLHDLGKAALPDKLLRKREKLSEEETTARRAHPVIGAKVLSTTASLREVAAIIRSHHERVDGLGYPDRLQGEAIPLGARIVAVADAYDAITHRHASTSAEALRILHKNAGSQFDPRVVSALDSLLATGPLQPIRHVA